MECLTNEKANLDLVLMFDELSLTWLASSDTTDALNRMTKLAQSAFPASRTLAIIDSTGKWLTRATNPGETLGSESQALRDNPLFLDCDEIHSGEPFEVYDLDTKGKVGDAETAQRKGFRSALAYPLTLHQQSRGYAVLLGSDNAHFDVRERKLIEVFAHQATVAVDHFDQATVLARAMALLSDLSGSVLRLSPHDFVDRLATCACELLEADACIVWKLDNAAGQLKVLAAYPTLDADLGDLRLDPLHQSVSHLMTGRVGWLSNVRKPSALYQHAELASKRGWNSLLSAPISFGERLVGMIDVYSLRTRHYPDWEKKLFKTFADQTAIALERADSTMRGWHFDNALQTNDAPQLQETLNLIAEQCSGLSRATRCLVRLHNRRTGFLDARVLFDVVQGLLSVADIAPVLPEQIVGRVARLGMSYRAGDISLLQTGEESLGARSLLCVPIYDRSGILGTVSVGSPEINAFSEDDQKVIEGLLYDVPRFLESAARRDNMVSWARLMSGEQPLDQFIEGVVSMVCTLIRVPVCFVWLMDKARNGFVLRRGNTELRDRADRSIPFVHRTDAKVAEVFLSTHAVVRKLELPGSDPFAEAADCKYNGLTATVPLILDGQELGVLQVCRFDDNATFDHEDRRALEAAAVPAMVGIRNRGRREKRFDLAEAVQEMARAETEDSLLELLCQKACQLTDTQRGAVAVLQSGLGPVIFRYHTHHLASTPLELPLNKGITLQAIREHVTIVVDDVNDFKYAQSYYKLWDDTTSELAVPLTVTTSMWIGEGRTAVPQALAAVNVESPAKGAFSRFDKETLEALAAPAALILQRLQTDKKLHALRDAEKELVGKRNETEIIDVVAQAITSALELDHLNISFVDSLSKRIRCKYIVSTQVPDEDHESFLRAADWSLKDKDIQSWVVHHQQIVVPEKGDPRLEGGIHQQFQLNDLVRAYVPMVISIDRRVIGTVEAGYLKTRRTMIAERDIQILKQFVDYATSALDQSRKLGATKIIHEITSPLAAIQNNATYLNEKWSQLSKAKIDRKLADILLDSVLGLVQIGHLRHLFGKRPPRSIPRLTFVMRDVVFKVLYQLVPEFRARKIDFRSQIVFDNRDSKRLRLWVDPARLTQVVVNLINNSIKYHNQAKEFQLIVELAESDPHCYIIRISDLGIGIAVGLEERIFDDGFRAPEAQKLNVTGNGVGLTIARNLMRSMGGELKLTNRVDPTTFEMSIPRALERNPT